MHHHYDTHTTWSISAHNLAGAGPQSSGSVMTHLLAPSPTPPPRALNATFQLPTQYLYVHREAMWHRLPLQWRVAEPHSAHREDTGRNERRRWDEQVSTTKQSTAAEGTPFIVVLWGLGGIGKSQLALHFALRTGETGHSSPSSPALSAPRYALRAWFDASSVDQLQSAYRRFATSTLQLATVQPHTPHDEVREAVKAWLDAHESWLLVYDNVHSYDDIKEYLPSSDFPAPRLPSSLTSLSTPSTSSPSSPLSPSTASSSSRHVLITSRSRTWPPPPLVHEVEVDERMTHSESIELLVRLMHKRQPRPLLAYCLQDAAYQSLAARLHHYPLAITQAGAYLNQELLVSLSEYTAQCDQLLLQPHQLLPPGDIREDTIARTFLTSIRAVADHARRRGMRPVGRAVLIACAYLHPDGIRVAVLERWLQREFDDDVAATPQLLEATVSLLQAYSLLQLDVVNRQVRVHRALQSVVRQLHGIGHPINDGSRRSFIQLSSTAIAWLLVPVRMAVHSLFGSAVSVDRLSLSWYVRLMEATVYGYQQDEPSRQQYLAHLDELQCHYYTHLAPLLRAAGEPCPDVVVCALLVLGEGRRSHPTQPRPPTSAPAPREPTSRLSSKDVLLQCLAEYEQLQHLHTSPFFHRLFYHLTSISWDEGRAEDGLGFIERTHRLREASPEGAVSVHDHVLCLHLQQQLLRELGRHGEELVVCEQLLALAKQHFSGDDYIPDAIGVPGCMYSLALAYGWAARFAERAEMMRSALRLLQDYCQRHRDAPVPLAVRQMRIAIRSGLRLRAVDDESLTALQQLLGETQQLHGEVSVECARTWDFLTACHKQAGHYQLAVEAATEAVRIRQLLLGEQHRELIWPYRQLANVHKRWRKHALAVAAYEQAAISCQRDASGHLRLAGIQTRMADCYFELGQWADAKRCYSEALPVYEEARPQGLMVARLQWKLHKALDRAGEQPARQVELLTGALVIYIALGVEPDAEMVRERLRELQGEQEQRGVPSAPSSAAEAPSSTPPSPSSPR